MDRAGADPAALLAGLHDIRLPVEAAGGAWAVAAAAMAVGLLIALCLTPHIRLMTAPRRREAPRGLTERLAALDALPPERRQEALLRLAAETRPELLTRLGPGIYRRDGAPSAAAIEAELRRAGA